MLIKLPRRLNLLSVVLLSCIPFVCGPASADDKTANEKKTESTATVSYHKQIEPILRNNCFGCHQGAKQLGSYMMTDFEKLLAGGESENPAVVAGKPDESYLIEQITPVDGHVEMPKAPAQGTRGI